MEKAHIKLELSRMSVADQLAEAAHYRRFGRFNIGR